MDASEFIGENNIKRETEHFAIADKQKKAGKKYFVLSRSTNALSDLFENTRRWSLQAKKAFSSKQTRMEVIHEHSHGRCGDSCSREWLNCDLEVLQENNIYLSSIFQY